MPGVLDEPKLTAEQFRRWKAEKEVTQRLAAQEAEAKRREDILAGRIPLEELTGKELAEHHPEVFEGY